ncbi:SsgA family sporulation/cell division regulator [Streptomyces justiciae]|uniref:SsgA family sporulation/cell division regulator n=1 Tax=Streptomyces justiciae TaxID=2780140 RepID=A0ABU3LYB1_9ACTN|nr:SsgA family sporulation/cell division regulator [Streptomyces justiciae]MDT7843724.1 SsgA family sporulation/cell division regulator [Streptomyces justiciae]
MSITLEQPTGASLLTPDDEELAVTLTLRYTSADPLAVHLLFPAWISLDGEELTWTFARSLLEEGLGSPAGVGNVHIRPYGPTRTAVEFRAPEGVAIVLFDTTTLHRFLLRTYTITEPGGEPVGRELEQGLASLLGGV